MTHEEFPSFTAAAVQAAPVFLDAAATVDKACSLIREAGRKGARLVAFPEVFVPGYPYWNWITDPITGSAWFEKLVRASIHVPGPEVQALCRAARDAGAYVVIGVNERSKISLGVLYNSMLFIGDDGTLLGKHRKLVPTWAEKLTWSHGDGSSSASLRYCDWAARWPGLRGEHQYACAVRAVGPGRARACRQLYLPAGGAARL